jgi:preprotein translocase subunit YajC
MRFFSALLGLLVAQKVWAFAPAPGSQGPDLQNLLMMFIAMGAIFYFIVLRPQQREQKAHQDRISNLQKGDRIVTSGGIHGTVRATKEKTVVVEIAEGVKITINRQAVTAVLEGIPGKGRSDSEDDEEE